MNKPHHRARPEPEPFGPGTQTNGPAALVRWAASPASRRARPLTWAGGPPELPRRRAPGGPPGKTGWRSTPADVAAHHRHERALNTRMLLSRPGPAPAPGCSRASYPSNSPRQSRREHAMPGVAFPPCRKPLVHRNGHIDARALRLWSGSRQTRNPAAGRPLGGFMAGGLGSAGSGGCARPPRQCGHTMRAGRRRRRDRRAMRCRPGAPRSRGGGPRSARSG